MPANGRLILELPDNSSFKELILIEVLDPRTWRALPRDDSDYQSFAVACAAGFYDDMENTNKTSVQSIYISAKQDEAGRHLFLSLGEAASIMERRLAEHLAFIPEDKVKALRDDAGAVLLYARPHKELPTVGSGHLPIEPDDDEPSELHSIETPKTVNKPWKAAPAYSPTFPDSTLCPHSSPWARNYSVIPELSVGRTQLLILCDEATLTRSLPDEKIFEYLTLVVNCHESRLAPGKYKVGSCSSAGGGGPSVICQAVHEWHSLDDTRMNRVNDEIQQSMWDALQKGTVAVHCLAGIHRAACIVACHFLWRHYILGHADISSDPNVIYQKLKAVRPAVSPAYTHVLMKYEAHLKRRAASKR